MTLKEYQMQTLRTASADVDLVNCCFGMIGETGEVVDLIKKHLYQGHPMDESLRLKLTKEIGDTMWYICMVANLCDIWMEDVIATNVEKLQARYPEGFTVEKSINRDTEEK